jgi:hypothetical protein
MILRAGSLLSINPSTREQMKPPKTGDMTICCLVRAMVVICSDGGGRLLAVDMYVKIMSEAFQQKKGKG